MNSFMTFLKGFAVGAAMLVPGASGGTAAIILGIYDRLIGAVSSLRKNFLKTQYFYRFFLSRDFGNFSSFKSGVIPF